MEKDRGVNIERDRATVSLEEISALQQETAVN